MVMKRIELQRRLDQEEYILGGIKPSSKKYQVQFQKVKDIKTELEFLAIQESKKQIDNNGKMKPAKKQYSKP